MVPHPPCSGVRDPGPRQTLNAILQSPSLMPCPIPTVVSNEQTQNLLRGPRLAASLAGGQHRQPRHGDVPKENLELSRQRSGTTLLGLNLWDAFIYGVWLAWLGRNTNCALLLGTIP